MAKQSAKNKPSNTTTPTVRSQAMFAVASNDYQHKWAMLALFVLGFLLYANTLGHGFVLDDPLSIGLNEYVHQGFGGIWEILTTNYRAGIEGANSSGSVYRPLSLIMFAIEWAISPNSAFIGHLMNVLLYALTAVLVYAVFFQLFDGEPYLAFAAALLFVAHPIHTETVANIKSRDEILCLFFLLCSLWNYSRYLSSERIAYLVATLACYFLCLLSKENAVTMFPLFALLHYYRRPDIWRSALQLAWIAIPVVLFFLLRQYALTHSTGITTVDKMDNPIVAADGLATQWATGIFVVGKYLTMLLVPYPLVCDYSFNQIPLKTGLEPSVWVSLLFSLALLLGGLVLFFRRRHIIGLMVLALLLALSIYSQIFLVIGTLFGERLAYLPSFWFCGGLVCALFWATQSIGQTSGVPSIPLGIVGVVSVLFCGMTVLRNPAWKDNLTLFSLDSPKAPNSLRLHDHLGTETYKYFVEHQQTLSPAQSDSLFNIILQQTEKALAIDQTPTAYLNAGNVRYAQKNYPAAAEQYEKAISILSGFAVAHQNLAATYREWGRIEGQQNNNPVKAVELLEKAIEHNPNDASSYNFLGVANGMQNRNQAAADYFDKALSFDPSNKEFLQNALIAHRILGNAARVQAIEGQLQGK